MQANGSYILKSHCRQGTSAEQDQRFGDKQKKLLKSMKFPKIFDKKVDVKKVNMTVIRPWVTARIVEMVGFEDDVLIEFVFNLLEADKVDPRTMQIEISGFLEGNAPTFMKDLWGLLASAQSTIGGIPQQFLDQKKAEIIKKRAEDEEIRLKLEAQQAKEATERAERQAALMIERAEAAMSALSMTEIGARIGGTMTAAATIIIVRIQGDCQEMPASVIARRNGIATEIGLAMNGVGQIEHELRQVRRVIQVIVASSGSYTSDTGSYTGSSMSDSHTGSGTDSGSDSGRSRSPPQRRPHARAVERSGTRKVSSASERSRPTASSNTPAPRNA
ncbi:Serine/arginine repetitive matrix protein 1 [Geranomyces variabilis]|uniref:Serine/arginine repetitive matrix protein 1 n=1 Tax=Geranomyces variabilis TaxID=109894 RepID=A0AAD5TN43_9FUNG|nr:Serine/arginine repetitive matrix protein 1 [Geranomyces variabilis]